MKHRPRKSSGIFRGISKIPISKSIARKAGLVLGVDAKEVINVHDNRSQLEAMITKLDPSQILDLLIEIDLILQQAENTAKRSVNATRTINEKLNDALLENQKVLKQLSTLVHGDDISDQDESIDQLIPTVSSLVSELQTQNRQLELARRKAEEAAESKMNFLANMSHEIRTPMNGIFGMVSLVLGTNLDLEQQDYIETIQSSTESLLTILNDVLEYSKISNTGVSLDSREFNLRKLVSEVIRTFDATARSKGLKLNSLVYPDIPSTLIGDDHRIRQILTNLVGNAIKFTDDGYVRVKVSYKMNRGSGSLMRFSVIDTGIGMESQIIDKLFQPFTQADASITRKFGGTGLGLTICRDLAQAMGGEIVVESEIGKGTLFHFEVCLDDAESENSKISSSQTINDMNAGKKFTNKPILVVEDNLINQKVTSLIVQKLGYPVTIANNGQEAVDLCEKNDYSVVFMDLSMPEMDGFEATEKIRSKEKGNSRATIIAVTGHAFLEYRQRCKDIGIDDFLAKPYNLFKLKEKLDFYTADTFD